VKLPEFSDYLPATLIDSRPAAESQAFLSVEPPRGFVDEHTAAGQFCKMRVAGVEGIFAMLSAPGRAPRFLVRTGNPDGGEAADALAALPARSPIEMTMPAGEGFALERATGKDLCFVATGTGVAPVCAAIEHVLSRREEYGRISLDHGLRTARHLAIADDIERWRESGVVVRLVYSSLDEAGALTGITVQDSLRQSATDLADAFVVGVGQSAMIEALRELLRDHGGAPDALLTNV